MARCFGVWHGCVRVLGVPIACPVAIIVIRRRFQQHVVARIGVWRDMSGDGIGYDFEYMRAAALHFPTVNTGYWDTLGSRTFSTVSVQIILHYRRLRRPVFL